MRIKITLLIFLLTTLIAINLSGQEIPLVYDVENTGSDCPEPSFPSFDSLPGIHSLPDPFMWADSSGRITSVDDWRCRRAEIGALIEHYELGTKPEPPDSLEASFTADTLIKFPPMFEGGDSISITGPLLTVTVVEGGETLTLNVPISLPEEGEGPFPAVIGVGSPTGSLPADIFTDRGIATIHYLESQVANAWSVTRGDGVFFELYPDTKRGKFIAFAWGTSRIIDGLEKCPEANIDLSHLAITGCSYAGKIALFSGALDERIALTIPQEPGGGGDAAWRVTETLDGSRETLRNALTYKWYHQDLYDFRNSVARLPFDHHQLMAIIAPRALLVIGNPDMEWLAEESGHVGCKAAKKVWEAFGVPDRFGFSKVGHSDHCVLPESQRSEIIAFVEKFLLGDTSANTNIEISPYDPDLTPWIPWDVPELEGASVSASIIDIDLMLNEPNPFSSVTNIYYYLEKESHVQLSVYDITGQKIRTLINEQQGSGKKTLTFDGTDLPNGIYICTLEVGSLTQSRKMLLLH